MKQRLKSITPLNWVLLAVVIALGVLWFIAESRNAEAERVLLNHYEEIIEQGAREKDANALERDSINNLIKKKDIRIAYLNASIGSSKTRVITIYKDSDEKLDYIASAGRDTTRQLFTGYLRE